jgi:hypothetical protein
MKNKRKKCEDGGVSGKENSGEKGNKIEKQM